MIALGTLFLLVRWHVVDSAVDRVSRAELLMLEQRHQDAIDALGPLLWFDPQDDRALLIQGVCLKATHRYSDAVAVLKRIPLDSPLRESAEDAIASSLASDLQIDAAVRLLDDHLQQFPGSLVARHLLTGLYELELRPDDLSELYSGLLRRFPDDRNVLQYLLLLDAKDLPPGAVVEKLEAADRAHPDQPFVVRGLALAYAYLGSTSSAQVRFTQAVALRPDDPSILVSAAKFHIDNGDFRLAAEMLDTAAPHIPASDRVTADYQAQRSRLAAEEGQFDQAASLLDQAVSLQPSSAPLALMQSQVLRRLGRNDESAATADRAFRLSQGRDRLMVLSDQIDLSHPNPSVCLEIASILAERQQEDQAAGWRALARWAEDGAANGVDRSQ